LPGSFKRLLVTGGCGFIGSHFVRYVLQTARPELVVNLDKLTCAGRPENVADVAQDRRYRFVRGDIADAGLVDRVAREEKLDAVVNFAAESHVDRSLQSAADFARTNVQGTQVLVEAARRRGIRRFLQVSTDEVYGSLGPTGRFTESSPLNPSNPYSASKAGADLLVLAGARSFGQDVVVTRHSNNYGPHQHPEKLIPKLITNAMQDQPLPLYGDGGNVRDWLFVHDNARAVHLALEKGRAGEVYNVGGNSGRTNLEVARAILKILGKPESLIRFVTDRPGHDRRYAMDASKIEAEAGFRPSLPFEVGLRTTVDWYRKNEAWVRAVRSPAAS